MANALLEIATLLRQLSTLAERLADQYPIESQGQTTVNENGRIRIAESELSTRAKTALRRGCYVTLQDICDHMPHELEEIRGIGPDTCNEIVAYIRKLGLKFKYE